MLLFFKAYDIQTRPSGLSFDPPPGPAIPEIANRTSDCVRNFNPLSFQLLLLH